MNAENLGKAYFELMNERSMEVHKKIEEYIRQFEGIGDQIRFGRLYEVMIQLPHVRTGKGIMRSIMTDLIYRIYGGDTSRDILPALAVSEINNINAYLDNIILDNKKHLWEGSNVRKKVSEYTIASGLFRELIDWVIREEISTSNQNKLRILGALSQSMSRSYRGQQLDLEIGLESIDAFTNDEGYYAWYLGKSELQSGYLYGFSLELGAILAGATEEQIQAAEKIGRAIGTGLHISNDLGDFAVANTSSEATGFKYYQDQLADIRNGRLTFPIYHVLRHGTEDERQTLLTIVGKNIVTIDESTAVSRAIHSSGAFGIGRKLLRRYFNQSKKLIHQGLPDTRERGLLSTIPSAIISNKFLSVLKKWKS